MGSTIDRLVSIQQASIGIRAARQQLLASNIANADTPNFKARDIDFKAQLSRAMTQEKSLSGHLSTTSPKHLQPSDKPIYPEVSYRIEQQSSVDGNTVDMDVERAQMAENGLRYEANINFLNHLLRSLQQAIQGQ